MKKEFRLPDVGEGLTEADIVSWHVKPGDTVTINQIIVDIETAKAVVELPSPYAGTVSALLVDEGQTVDVGTPIIAVDVPSADGAEPEPVQPADAPPQDTSAETAKAHAAGHPGAAACARRLRRKAGVDKPTAEEEAADAARLLPDHAVRTADRRTPLSPESTVTARIVPCRDQASARHSRSAPSPPQSPRGSPRVHGEDSGPTTSTTGNVLGAEGAVPGAARRGGNGGGTPPYAGGSPGGSPPRGGDSKQAPRETARAAPRQGSRHRPWRTAGKRA